MLLGQRPGEGELRFGDERGGDAADAAELHGAFERGDGRRDFAALQRERAPTGQRVGEVRVVGSACPFPPRRGVAVTGEGRFPVPRRP